MTIKTLDQHAYEIVTEEGTFAVCKDTLACAHTCHEDHEGHECAFCHLAFDPSEKCHEEILADLKELKAELAA